MRITSAGNVGIGTTNPGQLLHVKNNASSYAAIDIQGNQTGDVEWNLRPDGGTGTLLFCVMFIGGCGPVL